MSGSEKPEPKIGDIWHRYEDRRTASLDDWGDISRVSVHLQHYNLTVTKVTPKGVWLESPWPCRDKRFVRLTAIKRYAHPSKAEALASLKARKARQMDILATQLSYAERASALADVELAKLTGTTAALQNELLVLY